MLTMSPVMLSRLESVVSKDMPMLALAGEITPWLGTIMSLIIFAMILNTSVGILYAFSARIIYTSWLPLSFSPSHQAYWPSSSA